jgi:hypothetical protein
LSAEELIGALPPKLRKRGIARIEKERAKNRGEEMFPKLAEQRGNVHVIKDQLPTIFHHAGIPPGEIPKVTRAALAEYRSTLSPAYQTLLDRYQLEDVARPGAGTLISGYMGKSDVFDKAIGAFAKAYADQTEKDHAAMDRAVKKGILKAEFEEEE